LVKRLGERRGSATSLDEIGLNFTLWFGDKFGIRSVDGYKRWCINANGWSMGNNTYATIVTKMVHM
jgi:hypothetical protein